MSPNFVRVKDSHRDASNNHRGAFEISGAGLFVLLHMLHTALLTVQRSTPIDIPATPLGAIVIALLFFSTA